LFHRWKKEFNQDGISGLQPKYHTIDPEVKHLQSEIERLKRIIANQALELEFIGGNYYFDKFTFSSAN
jgi:putative transposase